MTVWIGCGPQLGCSFTVLLPSFSGGGGRSSLSSSSCSGCLMAMFNLMDLCFLPLARGPFISLLGSIPPLYFDPLRIFDNCFSLTSNFLHASFAVPSLRNLCLNLNHITAASNCVGPYLGALSTAGESVQGSMNFLSFSFCSSSIVFGLALTVRLANLEIGLCPNMEVELELTDTSPSFIRPFPIKESEKK